MVDSRSSKWETMSRAIRETRVSVPTTASRAAHLLFRLSRIVSSPLPLPLQNRCPDEVSHPLSVRFLRAALVIDRDGCTVINRPLDIINIDIITEYRRVLLSAISIGVPVKPMKEALGSASWRYLANPYEISPVVPLALAPNPYWLRCASSAMTIIFFGLKEQDSGLLLFRAGISESW